MRSLILATAAGALVAVPTMADAQRGPRPGMSMPRPGMNMPRPGGNWHAPRPGGMHQWRQPGMRWGNKIGGRWWVGGRAPGGWGGYRAPMIGWTLPSYWISPSYYITNWSGYGLPMAPSGYHWSRYYDDAVMVDGYGRVREYRSGLDWDRYDNGAHSVETWVDGKLVERHEMDGDDYIDERGPPLPPPPLGDRRGGRNDGAVTGAVVGGVLGGVAGNVIAGRGSRAAGTIVGAGVGAVAGAAIGGGKDRRDRREPPVAPYGAPYPPPGHGPMAHDGPPPPPGIDFDHDEIVQDVDGGMHRERHVIIKRRGDQRDITVNTGAYGGKPYTTVVRGPGTMTTVTVVPAVTTTTTTTEYVAPITYRKVVKKTVYRPRVKSKTCYCR